MKRYAIVKNKLVENVIEYEQQPITPPFGFEDGYVAIQSDTANIGWSYIDGVLVNTIPLGSVTTFQNIESNDGGERKDYLALVEQGNTSTPAESN